MATEKALFEYDKSIVDSYINIFGNDDFILENIALYYCGAYEDEKTHLNEVVETLLEKSKTNSFIAHYIDQESMAYDLKKHFFYEKAPNDKVYVFKHHH
jgi:hypothetical protein